MDGWSTSDGREGSAASQLTFNPRSRLKAGGRGCGSEDRWVPEVRDDCLSIHLYAADPARHLFQCCVGSEIIATQPRNEQACASFGRRLEQQRGHGAERILPERG